MQPAQPSLNGEASLPAVKVNNLFVARAVYGLITVLAVLQVLELHPPSAWSGAVTLFGTTVAVALVDAYADSLAEMLSHQRRLSSSELGAIGRDVGPVLIGAQPPTLIFVLAGIGLVSVERAISLAELAVFLLLFVFGLRVGRVLHENLFRQLLSGLFLVAIGGIIVGIKAAFH